MPEHTNAEAQPSRVRRTTGAAHAGLDVMLSEAATGGTPRFVAPGAAVKVSFGLARHPGRAASRAARLSSELRRVARGRSEIEPPKGDRRFADPPGLVVGCFAASFRATLRSARRSMA